MSEPPGADAPLGGEDASQAAGDQQDKRVLIENYVTELSTKIRTKAELRSTNLACVRPSDEYFSRLDSSLKRNTAFVKKIKQFTATHLDALLKDMAALNLTKYISEISAALVEAKLKMTDVNAAITLCCRLHCVYSDFSQAFFENWQKVLSIKPTDPIGNPSKLRVDLRLFAELIAVGIFTNKSGLPLLGTVLTNLISQDKEDHSNLSIILSFCRHCGEEYAGLVPASILSAAKSIGENKPLPMSTLLAPDKQQNLRNLLRDYFHSLCKYLRSEHKTLQSEHRVSRKLMETKGEVSTDRREKLELMQGNYDKLMTSIQTMADLLNEPMPDLPRDEEADKSGIVLDMIDDSADSLLDPWGDEETKSFYIDLPDLRLFLPNYAPKQVEPSVTDETIMTDESLDMDIDPNLLTVDEQEVSEETNATEADDNTTTTNPADDDTIPATANPTAAATAASASSKQQFEIFSSNLTNCVNKELIDSAAIEFLLNLNTKNNRKKLTKKLFGVKRTRLDLLPFFSRLVATINLVSPEVAVDLAQKLKNEFKYHIAKKNQMNIESKIKVVRFIGEMVKFGLYSKIEGLFCLKVLLLDFQHHQIEMTCAFLEVAGQYLYNCKESRLRTNVYLEQMMRLKTANALDSRYVAQIENSYFLVKPPEGLAGVQKVRPPMHLYIRHLVFEELAKSNVDKVIKQMRRLNWDDPEINAYAVKCMSKAYYIRYHLIRCLADLVSGISSYQDKAVVKVIDTVFEDIRAGLEIHSPRLAQRRVAMAKYLGELYNYRLVESPNILNTLYSIISLGVTMDHDNPSEMDPPESLFRLKLACVLLETCGQYFTSAVSRKRLDYFLVFFQQYYWFKKSHPMYSSEENVTNLFPILADYHYKETLSAVRPNLKLYKSLEQADREVERLRQLLYPNLNTSGNQEQGGGDGSSTNQLHTIDEDAEDKSNQLDMDVATDTAEATDHHELTEDNYTSEALGESDDDIVRGRNRGDGDMDEDDDNDRYYTSPIDRSESPKPPERPQEDIDFELAFEKMAADSHQERLRDTAKISTKDIAVPIMLRQGNAKKTYDQLSLPPTTADEPPVAPTSVPFVLMTRGQGKNAKQQFKTFNAPTDSQLAMNLRVQELKIREEHEKVKRLTLNITERLEEEDYQISLLQSQRPPTDARTQKQSKQRYKHQKGAPDADLIFG